jgi:hypothetical protein
VDINDVAPSIPRIGNTVCYGYTHLIKLQDNGNMNINNQDDDTFIPVITISTNTDFGRNLVRDSFTILKFIEDFDPEIQGCVEENSDEELKIKTNIGKLFSTGIIPDVDSGVDTTLNLTNTDTDSDSDSDSDSDTDSDSDGNSPIASSKLKASASVFVPHSATPASLPPVRKPILKASSAPFVPFVPRAVIGGSDEIWKRKYLKYKSKYLKYKTKLIL